MADGPQLQAVRRARRRFDSLLMQYDNVVGLGVGYRRVDGQWTDELAIHVFVSSKYPARHLPYEQTIPGLLPGPAGEPIHCDVLETGAIRSLQNPDIARYRPLQGGSSVGGLAEFGAGTLGGFVADNTDQSVVLLSCNHVLSSEPGALPSELRVTQPAPSDDTNFVADQTVIGAVKRILPIPTVTSATAPPNAPETPADCAIASIDPSVSILDDVLQIDGPAVYATAAPALNATVQKRGRTTQLTTNGSIASVDVSYTSPFGPAQNQWATIGGPMSGAFAVGSTDGNLFADEGDSGAIIFSQTQNDAVGAYPAIGMVCGTATKQGMPFVLASSMETIFSQLGLGTLCSIPFTRLVNGIGSDSPMIVIGAEETATRFRVLRDGILPRTQTGHALAAALRRLAPVVTRIWLTDTEARNLATRASRSWIGADSNDELLCRRVTAEDADLANALFDHLAAISPAQRHDFRVLQLLITGAVGSTVGELLDQPLPAVTPD
jgi:hypothetical protein